MLKAWEQTENVRYTELPVVYAPNYYLVKGVESMGGKVLIDNNAIVELYSFPSKLEGYKNSLGEVITFGKYTSCTEKWLEDEEDDEWSNIDSEFAYRKFVKEWHPFYSIRSVVEEIKFEVIERCPDVNEWVVSMRKLGGDIRDTLFTYYRRSYIIDLVGKSFLENGYSLVAKPFDSLGEMQLMLGDLNLSKFNSGFRTEYLCTAIPELKDYEKVHDCKLSVTECVAMQERDTLVINKCLKAFWGRNKKVDGVTIGEVREEINTILYHAREIEEKKSSSNKHHVVKRLMELDKKLGGLV